MFLRFKQSICVSEGSNTNLMVSTLMQTWGKFWENVMTGRAMRLQVRATEKQSFQRKLLGLQKMSEVIKEIAVFRRIPSNLTHEKHDTLCNNGFMASLRAQRSCNVGQRSFCMTGIPPNTPSMKKATLCIVRWPGLFSFPQTSCLDLAQLPTSQVKLIVIVTSLLA